MTAPRLRWSLACLLAALLAPVPAAAMQIQLETAQDGALYLAARGEIHVGDAALLRQGLAGVPAGKRIAGLLLDSPGGSLAEGNLMAGQIRANGLMVVVTSASQCASACFLMLAASPHRVAGANALIGVHRASIDGRENDESRSMSMTMLDAAGQYGVPPAIIGKMALTTPGRVEWLTRDDLALMDVKIIDDATATAAAAPPPAAPPSVAEYQGALFCRLGAAKLSLRLVDATDEAHRTALFSFVPTLTSRQSSSGSYMLEGHIDVAGGSIEMRPMQWVSPQPVDFTMVGLTGRSDDGGKTFIGRAAASASCGVFTLRRIR